MRKNKGNPKRTLASNTIQPLPQNNSDKWIDSVIESVLSACVSMTDKEFLTSFRPSLPLVKRDRISVALNVLSR